MTPEAKIKAQIKRVLKEKNVYYHMVNSSGLGSTGFPDFLLVIGGRTVTIEAKADSKRKPTLRQQLHMKKLRMAGAMTLLVHGGNIDEFSEVVDSIKDSTIMKYSLAKKFIYTECKV